MVSVVYHTMKMVGNKTSKVCVIDLMEYPGEGIFKTLLRHCNVRDISEIQREH